MSQWIKVCDVDAMAPGEHQVVDADGTAIAVFNIDGHYYAIEDLCTHDGGELAGGGLDGYEVICPRHGARFDVRTGAVCAPPAYSATACFPVRVDEHGVWTRDDRWD
jgi:3-phenylpropionate/trans-cinnamate dioxygenase ferredoxin component